MKQCKKCSCDLIVGKNWCISNQKHYKYLCYKCDNEYSREYYKQNKKRMRLQNKKRQKKNRTTPHGKYLAYRARARHKKLEFELSEIDFALLISSPCFYCSEIQLSFNGVDRVDSDKGYTMDNSVSCCSQCNRMKQIFTKESFINKCKQISEKQKVIL